MSQLFNYGTQGIIIGSTSPSNWTAEYTGSTPINGAQSSSVVFTYPRQDTIDWSEGGDPFLATRPIATLGFSYIFAHGTNESGLGFVFGSGTPALANLNSERNYYILINQANYDQIGYAGGNNFVMAFGNGVITRYDFKSSVGQPTICTVSVDCLNLLIQGTGSGNIIPYINKQNGAACTGKYSLPPFSQAISGYFEAAPSNIILSFDTGSAIGAIMSGNVSCLVQNFGFSVDLSRLASKQLGYAYPDNRPIHWPVTVSIHADAYVNGFQADALNRFGCPDSGWNFNVTFKSGASTVDYYSVQFIGAKLGNESFSEQIGDYTKVSMDWTTKIYDINRISGTAGNLFMNYA
jgi:hypothetical protein